MKLRPLGDRVLVRPEEGEESLPSGLVIPDTAKEKPQEGVVLAVGPGSFVDGKRVPVDVKEGDRVMYSKYGGTEIKVGGEELIVLSERDILGVLQG
ncbi:MAG: co-chaperone GroES [Candidatus Methylomirabilales bacterium]